MTTAIALADPIPHLFPASREIDDRYLEKAIPVIHEQLAKAVVRLAWLVNRALGTK